MILQAAAAVTTASLHNTTFAFSNVVGPQEDIILYGHPLSYISPTVSGFPQVSKKRNYFIFISNYFNKLSPNNWIFSSLLQYLIVGLMQALVIHYQSYANKLVIALAADEKLIPNPYQLCDDLQNSLQNMKEAVIKRGLIKESELVITMPKCTWFHRNRSRWLISDSFGRCHDICSFWNHLFYVCEKCLFLWRCFLPMRP